jgi:NADPH:quinone reductase-like Zn-dependent oxidoreductase
MQPEVMDAAVADLFRMFEAKQIKPEIMATYPLDDIHKAMDVIVSRKVKGKIVLTTDRA